jgi:hypothetical protein
MSVTDVSSSSSPAIALFSKACLNSRYPCFRRCSARAFRRSSQPIGYRLPGLFQPKNSLCGLGIPNLPAAKAENLTNCTASSTTQCRSNPFSGPSLPKTGIFQYPPRDYRLFRSGTDQIRSLETNRQFTKAGHWQALLALPRVKSPGTGLVGWGGRIRTFAW